MKNKELKDILEDFLHRFQNKEVESAEEYVRNIYDIGQYPTNDKKNRHRSL